MHAQFPNLCQHNFDVEYLALLQILLKKLILVCEAEAFQLCGIYHLDGRYLGYHISFDLIRKTSEIPQILEKFLEAKSQSRSMEVVDCVDAQLTEQLLPFWMSKIE